MPWAEGYTIRVRRAGWKDVVLENQGPAPEGRWLAVDMVRINDPGEMIQQLPSNYWMNLVLEEFDNRDHLLEYKMQCTYCHQQGSPLTSAASSRASSGWRSFVTWGGAAPSSVTASRRSCRITCWPLTTTPMC